ncbi:3-hydroxyacyl-CoA dehydrogenase family protein [Caulobacter segnis]
MEEGVASPEDLDTACRLGLGHPIGPFALMDAVSSDAALPAGPADPARRLWRAVPSSGPAKAARGGGLRRGADERVDSERRSRRARKADAG